MGVRVGKVPQIPYASCALFSLANIVIVQTAMYEHDVMDLGYYKFMLNIGGLSHTGIEKTFRRPLAAAEAHPGAPYNFVPCGSGSVWQMATWH